MFRSTVAVISSKQSDSGEWKSLRVLPLESYPLSFKINKSTIWMQADEKNRRVLLKSREGVQALNLNAEKVVLLGGEEFKIKCKKDITLLSQDSLKQSFGYSFVFHIAVMVLASIYMILNPMEVKVPEVKESISLNEVKELLKKVDEPPVVALHPKPEPPPPAPTPDPKPVEVVRAPQPKPAPVRPAPAPRNPTPVAKAPAEPVRKVAPKARGSAMQARQAVHTAPPTPNPAQVANRKAAKSLAFLSSSAGSFALADNKFSNSTVGGVAADAALSATASVGATQQGSKVLQGMARGGQASGPIQTRGSHGIGNPTAFEGHENGRDFENVQGRVAASGMKSWQFHWTHRSGVWCCSTESQPL